MILNMPIPPRKRRTAKSGAGELTHEELLALLIYCEITGIFRWRVSRGGVEAGSVAGRISPTTGYQEISINGKLYKAHRLAWLYVHGVWPSDQIDHIDRDKTNNRIANLREATSVENHRNMSKPSNNTSDHVGVSWDKTRQKWYAYITHERKMLNLGLYDRKEDAIAARIAGELHYWGAARAT